MLVWLKTVSKEKEIKIKRKRITIRKRRKVREIEIVKNSRAVPTGSVRQIPVWELPTVIRLFNPCTTGLHILYGTATGLRRLYDGCTTRVIVCACPSIISTREFSALILVIEVIPAVK